MALISIVTVTLIFFSNCSKFAPNEFQIVSPLEDGTGSELFTKESWEKSFSKKFGHHTPIVDIPSDVHLNEWDAFAWEAQYYVRALSVMAKITGESRYLDMAERIIDYVMDHRDSVKVESGSLDLMAEPYDLAPLKYLANVNLPFPGWRSQLDGQTRVETLHTGQIVNGFLHYVELVLSDHRFADRWPRATSYLNSFDSIISEHLDTFAAHHLPGVPGSFYYSQVRMAKLSPTGVNPLNFSATISTAMLIIDQLKNQQVYYPYIQNVVEYWKASLEVDARGALVWKYNPYKSALLGEQGGLYPVEDIEHAQLELDLVVRAFKDGRYGIDTQLMQALTRTLIENIYKGGTVELPSWRVDGSAEMAPDPGRTHALAIGWIELNSFSSEVCRLTKNHYRKYFSTPQWSRPFLGFAEILRLCS